MPEFSILSLPTEVQALVVQRVTQNSFGDLYRLRATCKSMQALGDDRRVYATLDFFKHPSNVRMSRRLLARSLREGNRSTLYIKGVDLFYVHESHQEGLALIRSAADAGCERALYTYAMTMKIYDQDDEYLSRFTLAESIGIGIIGQRS
ncbi:F-box protein [Raphanus sativus]|uniref:F-box protein At2g35280-like n=1 Tax=Raphanus sativus TaxID=3726 RepID=A0A6J0LFR7_RAPSA|nr:F-box protein At2g35280-like [Raphanus sativus]KAJ4885534.1 F-box protein [Raphanus sativus]